MWAKSEDYAVQFHSNWTNIAPPFVLLCFIPGFKVVALHKTWHWYYIRVWKSIYAPTFVPLYIQSLLIKPYANNNDLKLSAADNVSRVYVLVTLCQCQFACVSLAGMKVECGSTGSKTRIVYFFKWLVIGALKSNKLTTKCDTVRH